MTMTTAQAKAMTRTSRGYGWFRPNLNSPAGYRFCLRCRAQISVEVEAWGRNVDRRINDAIDKAMIRHLLEGCED